MTEHLQHKNQPAGWFRIVLALVVVAEAVAVFFGLKDLMQPGTLAAGVIPIVTAIVVAGAFYVMWDHMCRSVPTFRSAGRRAAGIFLGAGLMLVTIAASSWFIAAAIGGNAAMRVHEDEYVAQLQTELDKAATNAKIERAIYTKVLEVEAIMRGETKREKVFGTGSGKAGDGPVTMAYANAADSMQKLAKTLNDKNSESEMAQAKLLDLIKGMKQTNSQEVFTQKATDAASLLTKLNAITGVQEAQNFGVVIADPKAGDLKIQVEGLTADLRQTAKAVEDKRTKIDAPFYVPTTGAVAIIEYPSASPGAWIVGCAIDMVPFLVLLLLVLSHAEARETTIEAHVVQLKAVPAE
jgi:hypothetical protein